MNLRKTHPFLYHMILAVGLIETGIALNFWFARPPTFMPWGIHRYIVGTIFAVLAVPQFFFLTVYRSLPALRAVLAVSAFGMFSWGLANTQQTFADKASFQLPILFVGLAAVQILCLVEAPVNPMTERS